MVTDGLLEWYEENRRDLPWRRNREPYRVWVSEIMLQQTRVEAVIPYYERFLRELPDVNALAQASEEQLLKLWEGLGYYSRVRHMQRAARQIEENGGFPHSAKELKKLSGFGEYTAGAVASIAFSERAAAVDGNVLRVYARLEEIPQEIRTPSVRRDCERAVLESMPPEADPGIFNQALMELGACICTPKSPKCARCPLQKGCAAYADDAVEDYPVVGPKPEKTTEEFSVWLIWRDGRVLVRQRPRKGLLAGMWEFPHHIDEKNLRRKGKAPDVRHVFTHRIWLMHGEKAELFGEAPQGEWVDAEQLRRLPMPSAMEPFRQYCLESGSTRNEGTD